MRRIHLLFILLSCAAAALLISGCQDSGNPPPSGNAVTLTVVNSQTLQPYTPRGSPFRTAPGGAGRGWRPAVPASSRAG